MDGQEKSRGSSEWESCIINNPRLTEGSGIQKGLKQTMMGRPQRQIEYGGEGVLNG